MVVLGAYSGGTIANQGEFNPTKWDLNSNNTWMYMLGSAVVGRVSGGIGWGVSTGIPMANTLGIASASLVNSIGASIYTGGQTNLSISFGVASYNFDKSEWGYCGKKGNSFAENLGYSFGATANLADGVSAFGKGANVEVNAASIRDKELHSHSSITSLENDDINISVGPSRHNGLNIVRGRNQANYANQAGTWTVNVNNVNSQILESMTSNIYSGQGLYGLGSLKWNLLGFSCVNHASRALWAVGVPSLPINFHPFVLNMQLTIRKLGLYMNLYYHLKYE